MFSAGQESGGVKVVVVAAVAVDSVLGGGACEGVGCDIACQSGFVMI